MTTTRWIVTVLLATAVGCGLPQEFKQARQEIEKAKRETKERLSELQVRGEMDFELQEAFQVYWRCYQRAWEQGPVPDWGALTAAESALSVSGFRLADAKQKGLRPVFNLARPTDPKQLAATVVASAPSLNPAESWVLLANGKFDKVPNADLDSPGTAR